MYNKLLIPLDGSELGEAAIPFVEEIISGAKENRHIEITLIHIVPRKRDITIVNMSGPPIWPSAVPGTVPYTEAEMDQIKKKAADYFERIGATLNTNKNPNVTIKTLVKVNDDPAEEILKASDELKIDLIAISTHGRSGLSRWAYGSVADRILHGGNTPVLMVRAAKKAK